MSLLLFFNNSEPPRVVVTDFAITRFKALEQVPIKLSHLTVLVGANNAGKSSVLQAIQFATSLLQSARIAGNGWDADTLTATLAVEQLLYTPCIDVAALAFGRVLPEELTDAIQFNICANINDAKYDLQISVASGGAGNLRLQARGRQLGEMFSSVDQLFSMYVPGLAGIALTEEAKTPGVIIRSAAQGNANSVFRNVLLQLSKDEGAWNAFLSDLQVLYEDSEIVVSFNPDTDTHIHVSVLDGSGECPIESAGTGLLQAAQVLSYVHLYRPHLLLLDEPDARLHASNQKLLSRLLQTIAERHRLQIILATHSRHVLDELASSSQVYLLSAGQVRNEEFDFVATLLELGALDRVDKLRNGATKLVVLTEDAETAPLRALLSAAGINDLEIDLWSYKGVSNIETATTIAAFVREHSPDTLVLVYRDRDYLDDNEAESFKKELSAAGIRALLPWGTDIESFFVRSSHINALHPTISQERAEELIGIATGAVEKKSREKFINAEVTRHIGLRNRGKISSIDYGGISTDANAHYDSNAGRYRSGKMVLSHLSGLIQSEIQVHASLFRPTAFVAIPELVALAGEIDALAASTKA